MSLQEYCTRKTLDYAAEKGQRPRASTIRSGVAATDELLMKMSELTRRSRSRTRSRSSAAAWSMRWPTRSRYLHGKSFAIFGDPDFVFGMARFLMETGGEPVHCLATNGSKQWAEEMKALLASSPFGADGKVWPGKDLWHLRSLLFTEPVDFLIGNSYGKYLERDTGMPLIRLTFPIFDRHHHHRFPLWGYQGGLRLLTTVLDKIFDKLDADTSAAGQDICFDLTR